MTLPHPNLAGERAFPVAYLDDNFASLDGRVGNSFDPVVNGAFRWWQANTGLGAGTGLRYSADQWALNSNGTTLANSQQAFTVGANPLNVDVPYFMEIQSTTVAGAGNYGFIAQFLEDVRLLSSVGTWTWSLWARCAAGAPVAVEFTQNFGTGGAPSAAVTGLGATTLQLTNTWAQFSGTVTLPSLAGKVLGTNNDDNLQFSVWLDAGSNFNARTNTLGQHTTLMDISGVSMTPGNQLRTWYPKPKTQDLLECYRYFWVTQGSLFVADYGTAGMGVPRPLFFPSPMRKIPTCSNNWDSVSNLNNTSVINLSPHFGMVYAQIIAGPGVASANYSIGNTIDARF